MSGVQVRGNLKARPDGKFDDRLAATIGERLIALEKAARGIGDTFTAPGVIPGAPGAPGEPGAPGADGVTDHGELTGLFDDDHPQYLRHLELAPPLPHRHVSDIADNFNVMRDLIFTGLTGKARIVSPRVVEWTTAVQAGVDYTPTVGRMSWDSVEGTLCVFVASGA